MVNQFRYFCRTCNSSFEISTRLMLCPNCREESIEGKPLKGVLKVLLPEVFRYSKKPSDQFNLFDYLPVEKEYFPRLPVGNTPLIQGLNVQKEFNFESVYFKNDGVNPTGSFKDRASYLVSAFAKKNGISNIVLASTGNAASSMSGICASAGQNAIIFMPASAPRAKLVQCLQYGAKLIPIDADYDTAFDLSIEYSNLSGDLNRNTAYNPITIEGKKTVSFELVHQLNGEAPDYVFVPTGDGVILSGVIKGFLDLQEIGLINTIPKIIAVQACGSSFISNAFNTGEYDLGYKASTLADSISVNVARNAYSSIEDLKFVKGGVVTVSDEEILAAQKLLSASEGIFSEPSSAAAYAGFIKISEGINNQAKVVVLITGNGLKDIDGAIKGVKFPEIFKPDLNYILERI